MGHRKENATAGVQTTEGRELMGLWSKVSALRSQKEIDPVCGMQVEPRSASGSFTYQGKVYCFCAPACKIQFEKGPERFLAGAPGGRMRHH